MSLQIIDQRQRQILAAAVVIVWAGVAAMLAVARVSADVIDADQRRCRGVISQADEPALRTDRRRRHQQHQHQGQAPAARDQQVVEDGHW